MSRPLCKNCKMNSCAVNYHGKKKIYYRSVCEQCLSRKANPDKIKVPSWQLSGYKKKTKCELCGFIAVEHKQIAVLYVDGNLKNNNWPNLKSVCANCVIEISIKGLGWREDAVKPDL